MIHILARITVKPDAASAARTVLMQLVEQSRQEPGCVSYELYQQHAAPHVFQTVERWLDQESADGHMKTPHVAAAIAAGAAMFAAPPGILPYNKLT